MNLIWAAIFVVIILHHSSAGHLAGGRSIHGDFSFTAT